MERNVKRRTKKPQKLPAILHFIDVSPAVVVWRERRRWRALDGAKYQKMFMLSLFNELARSKKMRLRSG